MAEVAAEAPQSIAEENAPNSEKVETAQDNEVPAKENESNGASKREREEDETKEEILKKPKLDDESVEEADAEMKEGDEEKPVTVKLGPKEFESSEAMFNYFYKFLHFWAPNLDINKYEHMVLLELLKQGHAEPERKIGEGIQSFQVRFHPMWKSRCYFLVRADGSSDDFSFRKCVDQILPLPENMKPQSASNGKGGFDNKKSGGHQKGGGGGGGGGRGGRGGRGHGRKGGFRK